MVNSRRELFLVTRCFSFENHGNRIVLASQDDAEDRNSRASCAIESPLSAIAFSLEYSIAQIAWMCFAIYHFCSSGVGSKKSGIDSLDPWCSPQHVGRWLSQLRDACKR